MTQEPARDAGPDETPPPDYSQLSVRAPPIDDVPEYAWGRPNRLDPWDFVQQLAASIPNPNDNEGEDGEPGFVYRHLGDYLRNPFVNHPRGNKQLILTCVATINWLNCHYKVFPIWWKCIDGCPPHDAFDYWSVLKLTENPAEYRPRCFRPGCQGRIRPNTVLLNAQNEEIMTVSGENCMPSRMEEPLMWCCSCGNIRGGIWDSPAGPSRGCSHCDSYSESTCEQCVRCNKFLEPVRLCNGDLVKWGVLHQQRLALMARGNTDVAMDSVTVVRDPQRLVHGTVAADGDPRQDVWKIISSNLISASNLLKWAAARLAGWNTDVQDWKNKTYTPNSQSKATVESQERVAMHTLSLLAGLSAAGLAAAFHSHVDTAKSCLWSPLVREDQLTCAAPRPISKQKIQPGDERSGLGKDSQDNASKKYALPDPWIGPEQCHDEFCLFFNPKAGDGLSLITSARIASVAASLSFPPNIGVEPGAIYEAQVPEKGAGLFANRTIRKGEIIMQRTPAVLIQSRPHMDLDPISREALYKAAVDRLPSATRERFLGQIGNTVYDKVEKNSFRVFVDGEDTLSPHLGVYPEVSKMNHDCRPNVHYRLRDITHTSVAVRDIQPGEELTISYIFGKAPRATRLSQLEEWGFTCTCSQCTLPPNEAGASDNRIRQIKALEDEIERLMSRARGEGIRPEMGAKLVELYLAERLDAYLSPAYTRAALIYSMFGNEERAREYAQEAVAALERETGPYARDLESMRRLAEDPKKHWSWAIKATSGTPVVGKMANKTQVHKKG
ncbi:hypothetical protein VTJ49DRAFT_7175 [Mycothermus thermophilus]|uniref:SET domain-containing protein n=1 Tax=Humicola insolens TaxID=85995 RepID=A0ABR3VPJ2_HUMIN